MYSVDELETKALIVPLVVEMSAISKSVVALSRVKVIVAAPLTDGVALVIVTVGKLLSIV